MVSVAGRIMAARVMGKLAFLRLMDDTGSIQVMMELHVLGKKCFTAGR